MQAFDVTPRGSLRHRASGKWHPKGGAAMPSLDTVLVLYDGCDEERLRFNNVAGIVTFF